MLVKNLFNSTYIKLTHIYTVKTYIYHFSVSVQRHHLKFNSHITREIMGMQFAHGFDSQFNDMISVGSNALYNNALCNIITFVVTK